MNYETACKFKAPTIYFFKRVMTEEQKARAREKKCYLCGGEPQDKSVRFPTCVPCRSSHANKTSTQLLKEARKENLRRKRNEWQKEDYKEKMQDPEYNKKKKEYLRERYLKNKQS